MTKRAARLAAAGMGLALLVAPALSAVRGWSVRWSGGWTSVDGGDFSAGVKGFNDLIRGEYALVAGSLRPPGAGFDFRGEIEAELTPRLGLALGLGYLRARKTSAVEYDAGDIQSREEARSALSAVPLTLNACFRLPVRGRLSLRASAGPGLYLVRVRWDRDYAMSAAGAADAGRESWRASAARFGVQGRIAVEFAANASLSAFIEADGRWVRWSGVRGPWALQGSGGVSGDYRASGPRTLWTYDLAGEAGRYPLWALSDAEPRPARASGIEPGFVDLSGLSLRAGLRLSFF